MKTFTSTRAAPLWVIAMALAASPAGFAADAPAGAGAAAGKAVVRESPQTPRKPDLSGRKQVGKASFYAKQFEGRKMADGTPMDPNDDNAASKTLPLGTKAKVTNLETGKSAVVTIQDRGPYVKGRIVDVSPATARKIGLSRKDGVADVAVTPIEVPMPDGSVKPGAAAQTQVQDSGGWFDFLHSEK